MPLASLRSVVSVAEVGRCPLAARSASRGAGRPRRWRGACSGSCSASQRSLVTVNEATGTDPTASAQARRPALATAQLGHQVRGGLRRPGVVPEQGRAYDVAGLVEADHAVLLAADRDRGHVVEPAGRRDRRLAGPSTRRPDRPRCRRGGVPGRSRTQPAGVGVADDDLAGLGRGVDPGDQGHARSPAERRVDRAADQAGGADRPRPRRPARSARSAGCRWRAGASGGRSHRGSRRAARARAR